MINIGFDAKRAFWNNTGLGNYSRFVISGLITYCPENQYKLYSPGIFLHPELEPFLKTSNVNIEDLGKGITGKIRRITGFNTAGIDIYHGLSNELPRFLSKKTKKIVSIHDLLFLRYPRFYPVIDRKIYRRKTISACENADLVIAISEQTKSDLVNYLNVPEGKIVVHYQTCHPQFLVKRRKEDVEKTILKYGISKSYILQVGTLEERKNALLTLKAFSVSNHKKTHQLVLVGKRTSYCDILERFISQNFSEHTVKLIYTSDFKDFPALYQGASLTVYPSLFEGFGIPVLEAMQSGVPVITSEGGCFAEVGGNAVLYSNPENPEEMAARIDHVLSDTELSSDMKAKGSMRALEFSQEKLIYKLNEIYQSVLSH